MRPFRKGIEKKYQKDVDTIYFDKLALDQKLDYWGYTDDALGVRLRAKLVMDMKTKVCRCDYSGSLIAFIMWPYAFGNRGKERVHLGGGRVIDGAASTIEHEKWHIYGIPQAIVGNVMQAGIKDPSFAPGMHAQATKILNEEMSALDSLNNRQFQWATKPNKWTGNELCMHMLTQAVDKIRGRFSQLTEAAAWHNKSTDPRAWYDLVINYPK